MTVKEIVQAMNLTVLVEGDMNKEVCGCYVGDLLSWAMSRVQENDVWLTVMGNINAVGVAALSDAACIILTDNAALDEEAKKRADTQNINIFTCEDNNYKTALKIGALIG